MRLRITKGTKDAKSTKESQGRKKALQIVLSSTFVSFVVFVSFVSAQDDVSRAIGRPVTSIAFEVEGRPVVSSQLEALVPLRPGDPLRLEAVRDAETHLVISGGYEDVRVSYTDSATGVDVLFSLTPRHPVDRIEFTGETGLPAAELERQLRERYGGPPGRESPAGVAQALVRLLQDEGFPAPRVDPALVVSHDPDRATLVLDVAAGQRPNIARTEIRGSSPLSTERILERTGTAPGLPFRRSDIEARLAVIEDDLRQQGYYSAVALLPTEPVVSAADGGLVVTLLVNAGPQVTLEWAGPKPAGDEEDFVPMRRQRSVDEDLLEDSDQRVASYWRRQGYNDARVTHSRVVQDDRLVVTMHVGRGLRYRADAVQITGNAHMADDAVRETLGVRPGMPYDQSLIASGMARLRASYLRLGYHRVSIKELDPEEAARTPTQVNIMVRIDVAEGPQARIVKLSLSGVRTGFEAAIRRLMVSAVGAPYVRELLVRDRNEIESYYRNLGFENVAVTIPGPTPSGDDSRLDVVVNVNEGPQIVVGDLRVIGNRRVSEASVKDQITLREGHPFGEGDRRESARRLYQMGVFRQVSIDEEPRASGDTLAHVVITVEELPATSVGYGGGLEGGRQALKTSAETVEDRAFVAPRGFFEIGRRNLWGKNRSVDFFSRAAPRPATTTAANFGFLEYRVSTTYREPRAFHSNTDLTLGVSSEQAARTGFNFARRSGTLQVLRLASERVALTGRYSLEYTRLFDLDETIEFAPDRVTIDRLFPQVRLSLFATGVVWDRRDDLIDPGHGSLVSAEAEVSTRALGSDVGFVKVFTQAAAYHALTAARRTVLAGRIEVGLARGFARMRDGVTVEDLPVSQRFFAGGSTTVRGFQIDRLGIADRVADGVVKPGVLTEDGLSLGGNGVVIMNAELRRTLGTMLGREFGLAAFTDAGNVFPKATDIDFGRIRATVGFGVRYNSPLGPVRLDFGFKTDRRMIAGRRERGWEYHLNIGEAF